VNGAADNAKRVTNPILTDPTAAKAYLDREYAEPRMSERFDWIYKYDATSAEV
jgi:salicylate hydroxylase